MSWQEEKDKLAREIVTLLYENRLIRTFYRDKPEGWTLISGLYSPLYIQLRPIASHPELFDRICRAMTRLIREEAPEITKVIGIAMAGVPIAAGLSLCGSIPAGFTRKLEGVKTVEAFREVITSYGEHALVEGELVSGDRIALIDDLVTRFDSKAIAVEQVKHEAARRGLDGIRCDTVVVALDRQQGGAEAARKQGLKLLSLIPFKTVGLPLLEGVMSPPEFDVLTRYLEDPESFQNDEARREVEKTAGA